MHPCCVFLLVGLLAALCGLPAPARGEEAPNAPRADDFNYVLGTQTFAPAYRFTKETSLVETAQAILTMGANILKISLGSDYAQKYPGVPVNPALRSLRDLARDEPSYRRVFAMPFRHYLLWVYAFGSGWWADGLSEQESQAEYREIYDLTRYLLTEYNRSGKTFLLGHWEGDWHLHPDYDPGKDPRPQAIQGMIAWLNIRQKAIEDARRDTPHQDVAVYQYTEVNLVQKALKGGHTLTNDVLPRTQVDYVSYSSYDSLGEEGEALRATLRKALDYVESKLPPKPGFPGKRVFIGEYGFPALHVGAETQARKAREVARAALEWGCPYALYWEIYNNEVKDGKQNGFWLIDDRGEKQPAYRLHARFLAQARQWVAGEIRRTGKLPSDAAFRREALRLLEEE